MQVLCVTGPLGSGKTTTIMRLAAESGLPESTQLIVNEVGELQIDTDRLDGIVPPEQVNSLVAGCLGCDSAAEFDELVTGLKGDGIQLIIVEPTGVADPREIKQVTDRHGLAWSCLTLVNPRTFELNQAEGMLAAQLSVATAIGVTRSDSVDKQPDISAYVAGHASGVELFALPEDRALPFSVASLSELATEYYPSQHHACDHEHHEHSHGHGHGYSTVVFAVDEQYDAAELKSLFGSMEQPPERAKGILAGREFNWVGNDMSVGKVSSEPSHIVVISREAFDPALLGEHIREHETVGKKQLMRSDGNLEATLRAIDHHVANYPEPRDGSGLPVLGAESDIAWQMSRRPGVPESYKRLALKARMRFLLDAAAVLAEAERAGRYPSQLRLARDLLELGASLAWNAQENANYLEPEMVSEIARTRPAHLALRGLSMLPTLRLDLMADNASGPTTPEAMLSILEFGFAHEDLDREHALAALHHAAGLATGHAQWHNRWQTVIGKIE